MYATGLRVSELTGLELSNLGMGRGVVRVLGKGGKERLVPLGEEARNWLQRYLDEARPQLLKGAACQPGVRHRAPGGYDPAVVLAPAAPPCAGGGYHAKPVTAWPAPFVCHPSAQSRR